MKFNKEYDSKKIVLTMFLLAVIASAGLLDSLLEMGL